MNAGDVLRFTYCGSILGERACNVLYYVVSAWTGNITIEQAVAFVAVNWADVLTPTQTADFQWEQVTMDNVTNPVEQAVYAFDNPRNGLLGSFSASPFVAYSFRQNRQDTSTRHGYKRFAGVSEEVVNDGVLTLDSTYQPLFDNVADLLVNAYSDIDLAMFPAIVGRNSLGQPDLGRVNFPASVTIQPDATTQNTRKFGRGS